MEVFRIWYCIVIPVVMTTIIGAPIADLDYIFPALLLVIVVSDSSEIVYSITYIVVCDDRQCD